MFAAAAVCPHPPLLVPEVAAGAAPELDTLRQACTAAVDVLTRSAADLLVVVGLDEHGPRDHPPGSTGTFQRYGVDTQVTLGDPAMANPAMANPADRVAGPGGTTAGSRPGATPLPSALAVGAWLLEHSGWHGPVRGVGVAATQSAHACGALGAEIVQGPSRVALLVMGDASACRTEKAPGYLDPRAEPYDTAVATALRDGAPDRLAALDPLLADELKVAGRPAWQVLAGAAAGHTPRGRLLFHAAPYGVDYLVATWT